MDMRMNEEDVIAGLRVQLEWHQAREKRLEAEVERLRAKAEEWHRVANEGVRVMRTQTMEVERLRGLIDKMTGQKFYSRLSDAEAEVERLREALERIAAGNPDPRYGSAVGLAREVLTGEKV